MDIRSLTRGDGAVIGAALLLLIASFLPFYGLENCRSPVGGVEIDCTRSAWSGDLLPLLPSLHLAGLIAAALIVSARFLPQGRTVVGLGVDQWGTALAVFALWTALWALFGGGEEVELSAGGYLSFLFALLLAAGVVTRTLVPALAAPLLPAARPGGRQGPAGHQPAGYGYPGAAQQGQSQGGYGYPGGAAAAGGSASPSPQGTQGGAPAFTPFWFAVPANRPLMPEDGSSGAPVAELNPGVWYLAVDQRGQALVAQTQDGRRGILQDTTGIQRG